MNDAERHEPNGSKTSLAYNSLTETDTRGHFIPEHGSTRAALQAATLQVRSVPVAPARPQTRRRGHRRGASLPLGQLTAYDHVMINCEKCGHALRKAAVGVAMICAACGTVAIPTPPNPQSYGQVLPHIRRRPEFILG
jgi:hypothetical protein